MLGFSPGSLKLKERFTPYTPVPYPVGQMSILGWYGYVDAAATVDYPDPTYDPLEGERCWSESHPGPPFQTGGPFAHVHTREGAYEVMNRGTYYSWDYYRTYRYTGGFVCGRRLRSYENTFFPRTFLTGCYSGYGDPTPYGPQAWNKFKPGQSIADLAVFLAEMRDVPRMMQSTAKAFRDIWKALFGRSRNVTREMANHWLNTQFGWLPFISDMRKFYRAYETAHRMLAEISRTNGKWTRSGGTVTRVEDVEVVESNSTYSAHWPSLNIYFYPPSGGPYGNFETTRKTSERVWFEGAFRFYIPEGILGTRGWELRTVANLWGLKLSPVVLWEITPWSWLIDWFSNAQEVFNSLDNGWAENLAAKYAYVMDRKETCYEVNSTLNLHSGPITATWTSFMRSKQRRGASPFGFNLSMGDLTPRQTSILGALGLSRVF